MRTLARNVDDASPEGTIELREFLGMIARRKWLILAVTALATAAAILYSYNRTPVYVSRAEVLVKPTLSNPLEPISPDRISLQTEIRVATSVPVASLARDLLESSDGAQTLLEDVSVSAPEETQVLVISYSHEDPSKAQRGAQAFADAYLTFRTDEAVESVTRHISGLTTQIDTLGEQIRSLNEQIATVPRGTAESEDLVDQRSALEATRLAIQNQLATASTLSVDAGQVIRPAQAPLSPSLPNHRLNVVLGALIGLLAGVGLASASERLRDRVENQASLEHIVDAPVIGVIPKTPAGRKAGLPITYEEPRSLAAESYRMLRTNLLAASSRPPVKSVLVTSAWMGEGKSTVASNLAVALAQMGKDVVLISADLRIPRVHALFGLANHWGLAQVLRGQVTLDQALCETPIQHLRVLPSGPVSDIAEPVELIQSDTMIEVIGRCEQADFVIIDGSPILPVADSLVIAGMVDAVLFVADSRSARPAAIAQSRNQLQQVHARVIGGVLNRVEVGKGLHPRGYGAYDYRAAPASEPKDNGRSVVQPANLQQRRSG